MTDPTARDLVKRLADDLELWLEYCGLSSLPQEEDESFLLLKEARAYLAQPEAEGPTPIPLTKRQPTEADCDADGQCWFWHPDHKSDEFSDG